MPGLARLSATSRGRSDARWEGSAAVGRYRRRVPVDDEQALRRYGDELAAAVEAAVGPWVERCVRSVAEAHGGWTPGLADAAATAGRAATAQVADELRTLLDLDVERQSTNPLAILRAASAHATAVLTGAGVPPVPRDEFARRAFPDDLYDLAPASFADVDEALREPGLVWGAAKAHTVLQRHRHET